MKNTATIIKTIGSHRVTRTTRPDGVEFALRSPGDAVVPIFTVPPTELAPLHTRLAVEVARRILTTQKS